MMLSGEIIAFLTLCLAVAGTYAKEVSDIARLKAQVEALQRKEEESTRLLTDLVTSIHRVEKALVKAGLIEIG
mgnify:FL=1